MTLPSIGLLEADTMTWKKSVPFAHSTRYRQPNRAGNSHVIGKRYSDAGTITTEHFHVGLQFEKLLLKQCAEMCGQTMTVTEVDHLGSTEAHEDVFVESVRVVKSNSCVGPGTTLWITILEWTAYLPEDW